MSAKSAVISDDDDDDDDDDFAFEDDLEDDPIEVDMKQQLAAIASRCEMLEAVAKEFGICGLKFHRPAGRSGVDDRIAENIVQSAVIVQLAKRMGVTVSFPSGMFER